MYDGCTVVGGTAQGLEAAYGDLLPSVRKGFRLVMMCKEWSLHAGEKMTGCGFVPIASKLA